MCYVSLQPIKEGFPLLLHTSAAMGTVLLTGLEIMATQAPGQALVTASHRLLTIEALMLKRSSRVIPGLRGTPMRRTGRGNG